jgi:hypothetical protein
MSSSRRRWPCRAPLLLFDRTSLVPGDLDDDEVVRACDLEIARIELEILHIVLADHLESVVLRDPGAGHRRMDDAADLLPIGLPLRRSIGTSGMWFS